MQPRVHVKSIPCSKLLMILQRQKITQFKHKRNICTKQTKTTCNTTNGNRRQALDFLLLTYDKHLQNVSDLNMFPTAYPFLDMGHSWQTQLENNKETIS